MLKLKAGVDVSQVQPEILLGLLIVKDVLDAHGLDCVVTALFDGQHGIGSLHRRGGECQAADIRSKLVPPELLPNLLQECRDHLGKDYDIILEAAGGLNEHFHLEWDRKPVTVRL